MKRFLPMCEIVAVASGSEQYFQEMAEQFKDIPSVDKAKRIFFLLAKNKNKKMKLVTSSGLTRSMLSLLDRSQRFVYRLALHILHQLCIEQLAKHRLHQYQAPLSHNCFLVRPYCEYS